MTEDLSNAVNRLEDENLVLRKVHDDERGHLAVLRDQIRHLQAELLSLKADNDALKADNVRLLRAQPHRRRLPIAGAVGLALIGVWLLPGPFSVARGCR